MLKLMTMLKTISKLSSASLVFFILRISKALIRLIVLCVNFPLIILYIKMLLFIPRYHGYRILVGVSPNTLPTSQLTSYNSLFTC